MGRDRRRWRRIGWRGRLVAAAWELEGVTALPRAAALKGQTRCLELLLAAGADAEKADVYGNTPLLIAADYGRLACVERLLEAGADKDAQNAYG